MHGRADEDGILWNVEKHEKIIIHWLFGGYGLGLGTLALAAAMGIYTTAPRCQ
jgi:hypothetical protein